MLIGSAICTGAPTSTFSVLLLGRALQGVGAGGVNISVRAILADRVDLSEYAVNWTVFALISGIGYSVGPVIGGYLTTTSWRWCFAINLPVGVIAMVLVVIVLRKELLGPQKLPELEGRDMSTAPRRFVTRLCTIDYGGQLLFLWGFGLLILALTWAGGNYAWGSPAVLAPLIIGATLASAWIIYERSMVPGSALARLFPRQRAMVPWDLLIQKDMGLLFLVNVSIGISMFAVMYFMNLYFALVEKRSSSSAGVSLLYFLPGLAGELLFYFSTTISFFSLFHILLSPHTDGYPHSWSIHGHVLVKCLATPDPPRADTGEHHLRSRYHSACVGHPRRPNQHHLRDDGPSGPRCWDAHESRLPARISVLPSINGSNLVSGLLCYPLWWAGRAHNHVDGVH